MTPAHIVFTPYRTVLVLALAAGFTLVGYTFLVSLPLIQGPSLTVTDPKSARIGNVAHIAGTTKRVAFLTVNEEAVPLSEDGSFSVYRAYPPGYTAVEIKARDRFGREIVTTSAFITEYSK